MYVCIKVPQVMSPHLKKIYSLDLMNRLSNYLNLNIAHDVCIAHQKFKNLHVYTLQK